jgi:hypothetical protein
MQNNTLELDVFYKKELQISAYVSLAMLSVKTFTSFAGTQFSDPWPQGFYIGLAAGAVLFVMQWVAITKHKKLGVMRELPKEQRAVYFVVSLIGVKIVSALLSLVI